MSSKLRGGALLTIGYILSPLSWWNDPFVNIPIAYLFGSLLALISPRLFTSSVIVGYWMTNVVGLVLLHKGASGISVRREGKQTNMKKKLFISLIVSGFYALLVLILGYFGILRAPSILRGE